MKEKEIKLSIYGACIGDYCGSQYEGLPKKPEGLRDWVPNPIDCDFTDDTTITMAVAMSVMESEDLESELVIPGICEKYMVALGRMRPIGFGGMFRKWIMSERRKPYGSFGNGACMRVSPIGLAAKSEEQAIKGALSVTDLTHNSIQAEAWASIVSAMVFHAKNCSDMREMREHAFRLCMECGVECNAYGFLVSALRDGIEKIHREYRFDVTCNGSVPQALTCFLTSSSFSDCLDRCLYIGGDTDTIGAIACSIAGAFYGDEGMSGYKGIIRRLPDTFGKIAELFSDRYLC